MSDTTELDAPAPPSPRTAGTPRKAPPAAVPTPKPSSPAPWSTFWLADRDIAVFTALAAVVFVLAVARWAQLSGWGLREIEIERLAPLGHNFRLDLNTATWVELAQLDGVGETLAQRIVDDRETNGPFGVVDDLDRVKGIGPKTLKRLRPFLRVEPPQAPAQ
jgi:competence ComEA-like helix-hairpin-helix protein